MLTPIELLLARHALGLPNDQRRSYRNRFITGRATRDHNFWMAMVERGAATRTSFSKTTDLFCLTPAGAKSALGPNERLCPEDFPPEDQTPTMDDRPAGRPSTAPS